MRIALSLVLVWHTASSAVAPAQGLRGDDDAVAMARRLIDRLGGAERWGRVRALHIVEEVHRADMAEPYRSESWRSLREPSIWFQAAPGGRRRAFARTVSGGWEVRGDSITSLPAADLRRWRGYWPRNIYVMFGRLAREDSLLELSTLGDRRFAVVDAVGGERLGEFELTIDGDLLRWSTAFGLESEEWIYGPLIAFGSVRMPAWGVRLRDGYRFYYREVTASEMDVAARRARELPRSHSRGPIQ